MDNILKLAIRDAGGTQIVATAAGVTRQGVDRWMHRGYLPRTEWTGETNYAEAIEKLTGGKFPKSLLLSIKPGKVA